MSSCPRCGCENPDSSRYCESCGSSLVVDDEVERIIPQEEFTKGMEFVEIRKTPERLRDRKIAVTLSVIASVSSLVMLLLWRMEFTLETPFMTEIESFSFLEIAAVSSYGTWIYILIVLAVVASVFGILSSFVAAYSATIVMVVSVLSCLPFYATQSFGLVDLPVVYSVSGLDQLCIPVLISFAIDVVGLLAGVFAAKSVSMDRRVFDRKTGGRHLGLMYNVDREWNHVARRRRCPIDVRTMDVST